MRILFCSEQPPLPPLDDGIRLPLHALVRELGHRHRVRVVALYELEREHGPALGHLRLVARPTKTLLSDAVLAARAEVTKRPLRADSLANRLLPEVREEVAAFMPDIVHVKPGRLPGSETLCRVYPRFSWCKMLGIEM